MEKTAHTAILGAGITGLCVAHSLRTASLDAPASYHLIESSDQVGGALQSTQDMGYLAEHGPNSILIKDQRVAQMLDDIGLGDDPSRNQLHESLDAREEAKKRYIVQDGQPHAMPSSLIGMLRTPLFSTRGKLRFGLEPFIGKYKGREQGKGEESFADFVRRRLGPDMLASAAGPFVSGIYAGNPENLSVRHAFPRLWNLEHHYGSFILGALALQWGGGKNPHRLAPSRMLSFRSGMHAMPSAIAKHLPKDSLKLQCQVSSIEPIHKNGKTGWSLSWTDASGNLQTGHYRQLVIAVPHHQLPSLPLPTSVLNALDPITQLHAPPVTSMVLGFKRDDITHPLDGFGMLIKQTENSPLLGVLFSSSMFDGRAPDGHVTLTCMMGGSIHPEYAKNDEQVVLDELNRLLGVTGSPTFRHRTTWNHAIPQYGLDYQNVLDALESCESHHPGLHFAGNYRGGISVGDCIVNGLELGRSLTSTENGA
ncbi:MAG: protoporphyrinogen oxidase [Verrucomicrobiae bacterium]|nr:protoporphyrinogen oxidase [Verrucomicrobiae bacterium]NNJ43099.1 protoporphyrinogen oxidase [Akkermansiaceae bacterium]